MSSAATQTHMCIYMVSYYEQKWAHTTQTTVCFSVTSQSPFFRGSCMCRPFVSMLRGLRRALCKAKACFPFSQIWSPVPWKPSPGPVLFCPSLHVYTLPSESAFFQNGSSDFPPLQKAICFMLSTLQILARVWKETFTNYVEPTTRIPEMAITEEISKVN